MDGRKLVHRRVDVKRCQRCNEFDVLMCHISRWLRWMSPAAKVERASLRSSTYMVDLHARLDGLLGPPNLRHRGLEFHVGDIGAYKEKGKY